VWDIIKEFVKGKRKEVLLKGEEHGHSSDRGEPISAAIV